jgi:hypothetical protein
MIDDTLAKRGQSHLIYNEPLRLVKKEKSRVSASTKAVKRDRSEVLPTQPSSSRPKTASNPHFREADKRDNSKAQLVTAQPSSSRSTSHPHVPNREEVKRDNSKVLSRQPPSSHVKTAFDPYFRGVKRDNSKALPVQPSSSRRKTASHPYFREGVERGNSEVLPTQSSSLRPKTAFDPYFREGVKPDNSELLSTQPSFSHPKAASDPHFLIRERVGSSSVPSSSTSAKARQTVTPAPRKRPSDTLDRTMKRQKSGNYPGCPICGGPHHLVKDCPITAEGPKRYFFLVSDFMMSLLIYFMDSIRAAIVRLEPQLGHGLTVAALRDILRRLKERG